MTRECKNIIILLIFLQFVVCGSGTNTTQHQNNTERTVTEQHAFKKPKTTQSFTFNEKHTKTTPATNFIETIRPLYHCNGNSIINKIYHANSTCYTPKDALQCYHDPIFCEKHFPSGHRELEDERPIYGEYKYLPHEKWIRVIQHGGVAFLYHPCLNETEKNYLQQIAGECLHRYIMTPYQKLTRKYPIALVSWGCYYVTTKMNETDLKQWLRDHNHTYKGPASHVLTSGKYETNLIKKSVVLTDEKDAIVCPSNEEKSQFVKTTLPPVILHKHDSIIHNRLHEFKTKREKPQVIVGNVTRTKVETGSAVWAAASLLFLCGLMIGVLLYTKMWSPKLRDYRYEIDPGGEFEYDPGYSQFSLLKSKQKFMSIFRTEQRNPRLDSMSKMNLMMPIVEEDDEDEAMFQR